VKFANRMSTLTPSTTLEITAKANEMKANGIDVIGLGAGEPDFNTPKHILDAAYQSMIEGKTKYTPAAGLIQLKDAIIEKMKRDQHLTYKRSEIIVMNGAKHALYTLFQVFLNEGDEVIIPTPYWVSYPEQVKLAGGVPIFVETNADQHFKVTVDQLKEVVTDSTKALVLNSPSNPTGMMYSRQELEEIGNFCLKHNVLIVSDEIYEKLVYGDNVHVSIAQISDELKSQTIIINGVSKSHSMTGWRIGYAVGNEEVIKKMTDLASHSTSNPTTTAQYATIAAYNGSQEEVEWMRTQFEERLNIIYPKLQEIPGFHCLKPQGAFYLFPHVKEAADNLGYSTVDEFAKDLLEKAHVAVIPGSGFGAPYYIRLSYATSLSLIEEAISRIHQFVTNK